MQPAYASGRYLLELVTCLFDRAVSERWRELPGGAIELPKMQIAARPFHAGHLSPSVPVAFGLAFASHGGYKYAVARRWR
jgi:hypothetical protein